MYLFITSTLLYAIRVRRPGLTQALQLSGVEFCNWHLCISYGVAGTGIFGRRTPFLFRSLGLTELCQSLMN